jgi:O-antigen ligase
VTLSTDRRALAGPAGLLVLALAVGALAGINPQLGLAAAMGLAFVTIVLADLSVGLCLYALLAFLSIVPDAGGGFLSFDKIAGALVALSWVATVAGRRKVRRAFVAAHPQFTAVLFFFLFWVVLSLTWSEVPGKGVESVTRYILDAFLFVIVYTAVRTRRHVIWLVGAFVTASALSGAYGLVAPPTPGTGDRLAGTIGEPNQLAAVLVAGVVLSLALAVVMKDNPLLRIGLVGASGLCLLATFLTLSRAGLIALICAAIASVIVAGRWRAPAAAFALATLAALFVFFAVVASPEQRGRVTQINGGSGRSDIWTVGWRMVQAHPVRGIGVGQFQTSAVHNQIAPGTIKRSDLIIATPKVAHNIYLQELSELGIVGLIPFLFILGFSLRCALRAARAFERKKDVGMELMSRAVVVGLIGILTADFFASEQFSKQLWLLLGLGPALLAMATRSEEERAEEGEIAAPLGPSRLEPTAAPRPAVAAG